MHIVCPFSMIILHLPPIFYHLKSTNNVMILILAPNTLQWLCMLCTRNQLYYFTCITSPHLRVFIQSRMTTQNMYIICLCFTAIFLLFAIISDL